VLFIASGFFTNGAKDWIASFEATKPSFRMRTWEMPQLRRLLSDRMDLAFRHEVETSALRRVSEIIAVEHELFDRLWYGRSEAAISDERPRRLLSRDLDNCTGSRSPYRRTVSSRTAPQGH
jgi:hypothetical protein